MVSNVAVTTRLLSLQYMQSHRCVCPRHNNFPQLQCMSHVIRLWLLLRIVLRTLPTTSIGFMYSIMDSPFLPQLLLRVAMRLWKQIWQKHHQLNWNWNETCLKGRQDQFAPLRHERTKVSWKNCYIQSKLSKHFVTHAKLANPVQVQIKDCSWTRGLQI